MPPTCLACSSPERDGIDKALIAGEPLRNIAKHVSISPAGLLRHKSHISQAIVRASERREERLDHNLLDEMRRVQHKAWELLARGESEGDHRGSIVALREVRECLESLGAILAKAGVGNGCRVTLEQVLDAQKRAAAAKHPSPRHERRNGALLLGTKKDTCRADVSVLRSGSSCSMEENAVQGGSYDHRRAKSRNKPAEPRGQKAVYGGDRTSALQRADV